MKERNVARCQIVNYLLLKCEHIAMTYKPQSMPGKPDSVIKHEKFSDLMNRYWGQVDNAVYAAEMACQVKTGMGMVMCNHKERPCPFRHDFLPADLSWCQIPALRALLGDHVPQHDIQIPEDDTQAQRKRER